MKLVVDNTRKWPLGIPPKRYDVDKDGVNVSLLGRWLSCREKARLYLLGWASKRVQSGRIFGVLVHGILENIYSDIQSGELDSLPSTKRVKREVEAMEKRWKKANPRADSETLQTLEINILLAEEIMPVYFKFWHTDITKMDWMALEHTFKVPIANTNLIGRMDGNFKPMKGRKVIWLLETKTKSHLGEHGESNLVDILPHELQANMYLGAMTILYKQVPGGLVLNIVRRPNQRMKKGEGPRAFAQRVAADIRKRPEYYFIRLRMSIDKSDLEKIRTEHQAMVRDFVQWSKGKGHHYRNSNECENKYGRCDYLPICSRGDYSGHYQRKPRVRDVEEELI
jgi:PD-(D/E)XK nuclease superfamily